VPRLPAHQNGNSSDAAAQLERLVVASATFRDHDTERREALAAQVEELTGHLGDRVVLHTCHRVELISFPADGEGLGWLPAGLEQATGHAAAERVLLIASGLDSAVLAEEQVLGQVREAYRSALESGTTGPVTNELLRRAIRFGKRVQSFAQPGGERSLADRAIHWLDEQATVRDGVARNAMVLGTGQMGRDLATAMAARGMRVTIASRSADRAVALAGALPDATRHRASTIAEALARRIAADVVAIALRSGSTRLEARHFGAQRPLVIDLSTPRTVAPDVAAQLGARLLDLDRLGAGASARRLTEAAERRLRGEARAEATAFAAWLNGRGSGDAIALLHARADEVRRHHFERLRRRRRLDDAQAAEVEAMTVAMLGELLHEPIVRLRQDPHAAARVREVFGLE
jgi:glutamyl-tRNA reductase